ncbi:MAG: lipid-A-disaccharide synthase [Phycisphaerae bacterium]
MQDGSVQPRVFVAAFEPSADMHGAGLIRAARSRRPDLQFVGFAGPQMRRAGCRVLEDLTVRSAMLVGAAGNVARAARIVWRAERLLGHCRFGAAVLIDSPTLNLPLAHRCRAHGVAVMYYIAPQTWAWGRFRLGKIRRRVDRLACILPFEQDYFRQRGINATFVGHPLFETLSAQVPCPGRIQQLRAGARVVVALLPGSRHHVIREVLPGQLAVAEAIRQRFSGARFLISAVDKRAVALIEGFLARTDLPASVLPHAAELICAADLALVASGTATLEVAYYLRPMIVMYNAPRWGYRLLGRWLIQARYLSLLNVLADRQIVPEFMPYYRSTEPIARRAIELLSDAAQRQRMRADLADVIAALRRPGASANAAALLLDLLAEACSKPSDRRLLRLQ